MLDYLVELDQQLLLWLNSLHTSATDSFWWVITNKYTWVPFYLILLGLLIREFRMKSIWILLALGLTIALSDQFASGFCKPFFERLRPSHEPLLQGLVHLFQYADGTFYRGGSFGFISSHAANSFGIATFFYLLWRKGNSYVKWLFLWAALVSYSRIALGVHYPADILAGAVSGMIWAWCSYTLLLALWKQYGNGALYA